MKHVLVPAGLLGFALTLPSVAEAYCRTTTKPREAGMCPEECITEGLPLYWGVPNALYTFNERGFPDLDDADARGAMARAFGHWNEVTCPSGDGNVAVGLDIQAAEGTTVLEVGPGPYDPNPDNLEVEPNDNVIVYFDGNEWSALGLSREAYALTAIWYNKNNGEILGADMHFNGGMGSLVNCPETGCDRGQVDLENVATHEAGHFVGLAHSDVPGSTMWCSADQTETEKRSLSQDDIDGLCEVYPPGNSFGESKSDTRGNCSLSPGRTVNGAHSLWLAGLAALFVRRRRRR